MVSSEIRAAALHEAVKIIGTTQNRDYVIQVAKEFEYYIRDGLTPMQSARYRGSAN